MPSFRRVFNASVLRGDWTGVEKAVCGFALGLYRQNHSPGDIVYIVPPGVLIPGIPKSLHYELPKYTRWRIGRIFFELFSMARLVRSLGADAFFAPAYLLPPRIRCATTLYVYDFHVYTCPKYCRLFNVLHYRLRMPQSVRCAGKIVVPSKRVAAILSALFPNAASKTVVERIPLLPPYDQPDCRRLANGWGGLPASRPFFLAVGSPSPRKNHENVIAAWRRLPAPRPALLITGGKAKASAEEDEPEYLGYVTDKEMASLYANTVALVYPSFDEGYGLPVAEALAMGAKVITTREIAKEFSQGQISFCGTDVETIHKALSDCLRATQSVGLDPL